MSEILFSVIVPVYNAEKTLRRCVDSLLEQADETVELIFVNDGSTDRSETICREYADANEAVILVSKPNGGVSTARNAGIERATGRYLLFVDSDDYMSPDWFSVLRPIAGQGWDYIHFSNCKVSGDDVKERILAPSTVRKGERIETKIAEMICSKTINQPWAKAFRREIVSRFSIRFPETLSLGEDKVFNLRFLLRAESYVALDAPLYYVCVDEADSLSRKQRTDLQDQLNGSLQLCREALAEMEWSQEKDRPVEEALNYMELRNIYTMAKEYHREGLPFQERLARIKALCKSLNEKHYRYPAGKKTAAIAMLVRNNLAAAIDAMALKLVR